MEKELLLLGNIIDTVGLDGTVKVFSTTNNQNIRYKKGNKVLLLNADTMSEMIIESYRPKGQFDYVKFETISSIEEAEKLKGFSINVYKDISDLKEGYYYFSDLEGCSVKDAHDKNYGKVIKVEEYPANINLRVKAENGKTFLLPFVKDFIVKIDIDNKTITINYMEGLLWE